MTLNIPSSINVGTPPPPLFHHHAPKTPCTPSEKHDSPTWQRWIHKRPSDSIFISATKLARTSERGTAWCPISGKSSESPDLVEAESVFVCVLKSINESVGDGALDRVLSIVQFRIRGVTGVTRRGDSEAELSVSSVESGTISVLSLACSASVSRVSKTRQDCTWPPHLEIACASRTSHLYA